VFRANFGLYAWRAGYKGTLPWVIPIRPADWRGTISIAIKGSDQQLGLRDEMMTYPTTDGVLVNRAVGGVSRGAGRPRYLGTLLHRIEQLGSDPRAAALQAWVNALAVPMASLPGGHASDLLHPPADIGTTPIDLDAVRGQIIDKILSTL